MSERVLQKWRVDIPQPKAARLAGRGTLVVTQSSGWGGGHTDRYPLPADAKQAAFKVPATVPWYRDTSILDGRTFGAKVEYANESGSRTEEYELTPTKVEEPPG